MAQTTSFTIANDNGLAVRGRINEIVAALLSLNSGPAAPTTTVPGMLWFDTGASPPQLRRRNATDSGWDAVLTGDGNLAGLASTAAARGNLGLGLAATLPLASQAQAEEGSAHDLVMTPLRTRQAVAHGETQIIGGYTAAAAEDGLQSGGSYTPTPAGGNFRAITNGGAFTLAAPEAPGVYTLILEIANGPAAGAVTFTGFARVMGDALTTTDGHRFQIGITRTPGGVGAVVMALQ